MIINGKEWKLVPVEATDAMVDAATGWLIDVDGFFRVARTINAAIAAAPPAPVVEANDETALELHRALHNARKEWIYKTKDPLPWYWDIAAWVYAVQFVLGPTLGLVTREEHARIMEALTELVALSTETMETRWGSDPIIEQDLRKRWAHGWTNARKVLKGES